MSAPAPVQSRRPRGRPSAEELADLEARLLTVGRETFYARGYGATTMSEIAKAARVSKTTLYIRFADKAALFRKIVAEQVASWDTGHNHMPMEDYPTLADTLRAYGDVVLRAGMTRDFIQMHRLMQSESGRFPELAEVADARFRRGVDYIAGYIRSFADHDAIQCDDAQGAAEMFMMTLMGWTSVAVVGNRIITTEIRREWLDRYLRAFLNGRAAW